MFSFKNNNLLPVLPTVRRSSNNSTILFTNARDEPNIAEWVAHHLLLGFNKIVIFLKYDSIQKFRSSSIKKII